MKDALASNWVVETADSVAGGFTLRGSSKGYTTFSRAFKPGDKVFYAAHDENGNREAGWAVAQGATLTGRTPTARLFNDVYEEGTPSEVAFSGPVTIACTFNAVAFDTIWDHVFREDNPHNVTADQVPQDDTNGRGDNVQDALDNISDDLNDHKADTSNPHDVKAPQVDLEPVLAPLGPDEQNVQDALEWLYSRFTEHNGGDWHITHIDGNYVYIEIKHGPRAEFPPNVNDLQLAELKINHDDGHLWTKLADGTVVKIGDKDLITEAPLDGELYGRKDGAWHRISLATVSDNMPQQPQEGDLWVDTGHTLELYVYAGGAWISMTGAGSGGGGALADNVVLDDMDGTMVGKLLGREMGEDGSAVWRPIYTDDVITQGAQPMFRSKETGRFTKATDPAAIRDQQTANWFLYESIMDMGDVHVDIDPPDDPTDGDMWYDTVRLELFVYAEGAWLPCSPLGARVDAGEILQADILSRVEAGEVKQTQIATAVEEKLGKNERNTVTENFRILGDRKTFISTSENELGLYNLRTPTSGPHATNKEYVDGEIDRKIAAIEFPESDVDKAYVDQQDDALDARITSGEQLQNQILADVRQNKNDIGSINILSQQNYGRSVKNEQDIADLQANVQEEAVQPLLWTFRGTSTLAENLNDGEFTFRYEGDQGSDGFFKIYTATRDASGQLIASPTTFQHNMQDHLLMSIQGPDGGNHIHMKSKTFFFHVGTSPNQYHRFEARFWRVATSCSAGEKYVLNIPGILPTFGKPSDVASFSLPDEPPCGDIPPEAES